MNIIKYTNIGGRNNNEDYCEYLTIEDKTCLVVCDGLGGHNNGEVASENVVKYIIEAFQKKQIISKDYMATLIEGAQNKILALQKMDEDLAEMKTTVTIVLLNAHTAIMGHVGDSRIYLFRKNKIIFESEDHSVPYALYKAKRIKKKEIRTHEDSNVVLRSIGSVWDGPKYEIKEICDLKSMDGFLLCTDGFWENITEKEMIKCYKKSSSSKEWVQKMLNIVQNNINDPNHDNYTCIAMILK